MDSSEQIPPVSQGTPPTPNPKKSKFSARLLAAAVVVLLFGGVAVGYWLKSTALNPPSSSTRQPDVSSADQTQGLPTSTAEQTPPSADPAACNTYSSPTRQLSGEIAWTKAQPIAEPDVFSNITTGGVDATFSKDNSEFYKVGTVQTGSYQGYEVILGDIAQEGPALYPVYYRFLRSGGKLVMLGKYSPELNEWDGLDRAKFTVDKNFFTSDLEYPETFQGATNRENFERDAYATFSFCADGLVKLFHHSTLGDVYTSPERTDLDGTALSKNLYSQGFYLASPDGTARVYELVIDFQGKDNVPRVTWSDGSKNTAEYTYTDIGGCGSTNYQAVVSPDKVNPSADLKEAGTNSFGDKVYLLKDPNHPLLKDIYEKQYYVYQGEKVSYDEFINSRPAFFWRNPFGRLVKFQNNKFVPLAECGKPVIYLYPQKRQAVSVKLSPAGGFSYSKPDYNGGWDVIADPAGILLSRTDGKIYPYLFWEGRGGLYPGPSDRGFIVPQEGVHAFLVEKLRALGLNAKEASDFIEFWEPRMQGSPYYFVTFYGNAVMNALAPLVVSPAPDTVIRVLMDFRPLLKPIPVKSYEIKTPVRRGFTVVEWGGVLRSE